MKPRIIFYCGIAPEPWAPPKVNESGVGGSETAVIEIARRFCADGWRVDVYGNPAHWEGEHDGVGYWDSERIGTKEAAEVLVAWRQPRAHALPVQAKTRLLWLHDHNYGPDATPDILAWDRVLGVSEYHRDFLRDAYGITGERTAFDFVPNGIDLARFDHTIKKVPFRCVYASSADRGLLTLLDLWPSIRGDESTAELHVAYGFESMSAIDQRWLSFRDQCLAKMEAMKPLGVVYRGRLPQDELARLYCESVASLYPSDFLETSCISMMEAMAGGCVPITSSCGALKSTVGDGGLVVYGPNGTRSNPYSPAWREYFCHIARSVLFEKNIRTIASAKARERAKALTWDCAFSDHWLRIVGQEVAPTSATHDAEDALERNPVLGRQSSKRLSRVA